MMRFSDVITVFPLALVLLSSGCITGAYVKYSKIHAGYGNYGASAEYAAMALARSPDDEEVRREATAVMLKAFERHTAAARELAARKKYSDALMEYEKLVEINAIGSSVGVPLPMAQVEEDRARLLADGGRYHLGEALRHKSDGEMKEAAEDFRLCSVFTPENKDCKKGYKESRAAATKTVAIVPFRSSTRPDMGRLMTAKFISEVKKSNPEFVKFIDRDNLAVLMKEQEKTLSDAFDEARAPEVGKLLGVNAFVFGELVSVRASDTGWKSTRSSNSVELPVKCKDENGEERECGKKTYTASWLVYTRETGASILASFKIVDTATAEITSSEEVTAELGDRSSYARCTGDSEAIPPSINCYGEQTEPRSAESLLEAAAADASDRLAKQFYRIFK